MYVLHAVIEMSLILRNKLVDLITQIGYKFIISVVVYSDNIQYMLIYIIES